MNLQFTSVTHNSDRTWTFRWADTGADSYRLVLYGVLLATTEELSYTWDGSGFIEYPPPVELVEVGTLAESEEHPPFLIAQWYSETFANFYTVEELQGVTWVEVKSLEESGEWVYSYSTQTLEDDTQYKLRVTAYDTLGNPNTPKGYTKDVLCNPATPDGDIAVGYSAGNIVISEA